MLLLEKVFKVINESGLDYCIQNKYEMMPEEIPSDIDMMYANADERFLDSMIGKICRETGGKLVQKYVQGFYQYTYILFFKDDNGEYFQIPLDFYRAISWKGYSNVMMAEEMLNTKRFYKCFYVPDTYVELKYMWIRRTIKEDLNVEHIDIAKKLYETCPIEFRRRLEIDFGKEVAEYELRCMELCSVEFFEQNKEAFKDAVKRIAKKNATIHNNLSKVAFAVKKIVPRRIMYHCGISIAFLSPDGGGKTTLIKGLNDFFTKMNIFDGVKNYYMRPKLFKNLGHYNRINPSEEENENPNPHGKKVNGKLKSFIRFMFYNIDYFIGTLIKVWPNKLAKKLVIYDRYYYDYYVDLKRYQYSFSDKIPRLFQWMIPQPEIVFVLDAPGEVLYNRKQELTLKELKRQRKLFLEIPDYVSHARIIDVNRPIEKILDELIDTSVELQERRTLRIYRGVK